MDNEVEGVRLRGRPEKTCSEVIEKRLLSPSAAATTTTHLKDNPDEQESEKNICSLTSCLCGSYTTPHHNHFTTIFPDHPGEPVPQENFCKGRLTEADTPTIQMDATPSGLTSAHLHHPHIFYRPDALPAAQPTASRLLYNIFINFLHFLQSVAWKMPWTAVNGES